MDRANIRLWVDALRSGDYQQGRDQLRFGDTYCCLGVACDVAMKNGVPVRWDALGNVREVGDDPDYGLGWSGAMHPLVSRWIGVTEHPGFQSGDIKVSMGRPDVDELYFLAELNDVLEMTFEEIADVIEDNYLKEEK